jgi:hypothetical protein
MHVVDAQPTRPKQRRPTSRKAMPGAPATMATTPNVLVAGAIQQHAIYQRLQRAKVDNIRWHIVLNNHASTRPKEHGGKLCNSITACKQFDRVGTRYRCRLKLPNSYTPDDGREVSATAVAAVKETASEDACCKVFARLCSDLHGLRRVIFRSVHYNVPCQELVDDIVAIINNTHDGGPSATVRPLAEHHAASGATFAGTLQDVPAGDLDRAAELIRLCLQAHDGGFFPSNIDHKKIVAVGGEPQVKAYAQLATLIPEKGLKQFIEQHPDFDSEEKGGRLYITWKSPTSPASAAHPSLAIQPLVSNRIPEAVNVAVANHHNKAALVWEKKDALQARQSFYYLAAVGDQAGAAAAGCDAWADGQPSSAAASGAPSASASAAPPDVEGATPEPEHYHLNQSTAELAKSHPMITGVPKHNDAHDAESLTSPVADPGSDDEIVLFKT